MKNSYILIIIIILILMFLSFRNKPKKSSFGLSCAKNQSKISWNGIQHCYNGGKHANLSKRHPEIGDMEIQAGPNTVKYFGMENFQRLRGTVSPGTTKNFRGWPWSVIILKN